MEDLIKKLSIDDGEARLSVDYEPEILGPEVITFVVSNGGGFASVYATIEETEELISNLTKLVQHIQIQK